jgi:hypothetical protein
VAKPGTKCKLRAYRNAGFAAAALVTNRHAAEAHKPATSLVTRTRDPQVAGLDPCPEIIERDAVVEYSVDFESQWS